MERKPVGVSRAAVIRPFTYSYTECQSHTCAWSINKISVTTPCSGWVLMLGHPSWVKPDTRNTCMLASRLCDNGVQLARPGVTASAWPVCATR